MGIAKIYITRVIVFVIFYRLLPAGSYAQKVQTFVDKKDILIGEQIQCKIKLTYPTNSFQMRGWQTPDSIKHFEIVGKGKMDSATKNGETIIDQTITYTSFDSGKWALPALAAWLTIPHSDSITQVYSDSILINVSYAAPDSTNRLRDIKPIMEVSDTDNFWYYIAGGALLLLFISWALWRFFTRKKPRLAEPVATLSAYNEAMQALDKLDSALAYSIKELKQYHIQLGAICKKYVGRKTGKKTGHYTTDDLLMELRPIFISPEETANLAAALRCGDAVKYAKFFASMAENDNCKMLIKNFIDTFERGFVKS